MSGPRLATAAVSNDQLRFGTFQPGQSRVTALRSDVGAVPGSTIIRAGNPPGLGTAYGFPASS
jgi:hypothetical protein